jgi:hypothetical protein
MKRLFTNLINSNQDLEFRVGSGNIETLILDTLKNGLNDEYWISDDKFLL